MSRRARGSRRIRTRSVRADPALRATPLVAITGYGQPEDRRRTAEAGFDEHLVKPISQDVMGRLLARLMV